MKRTVKTQFAADLRPGTRVNSPFLCTEIKVKETKHGEPFADVKLSDRTGDISLKLWNYSQRATPGLEPGSIVQIHNVSVTEYGGAPQLSLNCGAFGDAVTVCNPEECELGDFIPATTRDLEGMWSEIREAIARVRTKHIRCLLQAVFSSESTVKKFREWPAAVRHHHAYLGGLLEHTLAVLRLCRCAAEYYDHADIDLLTAGALLHDIGKIESYEYERSKGSASVSSKGILADHIISGVEAVAQSIRTLTQTCPDRNSCSHGCWTPEAELIIKHIILSHHGTLEWGSPVEPATIEACILHHADNMDAQVNKFERTIRDVGPVGEGQYRYVELLRKTVYIPPTSASALRLRDLE